MLKPERYNIILNMLNKNSFITVSEITKLFNVSSETARKDLLALEKENCLIRTRGGAISKTKGHVLTPLSIRAEENVSKKKELASFALKYISEGDVIALDEGSTAIEFAKLICEKFSNLTVVTHDLSVFNILSENSGIKLILCGGDYIPEENAFSGFLTVSSIKRLHTDKFFLCPSGISKKFGITVGDGALMEVESAYMESTDRVIVIADSEKFEKSSFLKIDDMSKDYTYVTDSALPDEIFDPYNNSGFITDRGN